MKTNEREQSMLTDINIYANLVHFRYVGEDKFSKWHRDHSKYDTCILNITRYQLYQLGTEMFLQV